MVTRTFGLYRFENAVNAALSDNAADFAMWQSSGIFHGKFKFSGLNFPENSPHARGDECPAVHYKESKLASLRWNTEENQHKSLQLKSAI